MSSSSRRCFTDSLYWDPSGEIGTPSSLVDVKLFNGEGTYADSVSDTVARGRCPELRDKLTLDVLPKPMRPSDCAGVAPRFREEIDDNDVFLFRVTG